MPTKTTEKELADQLVSAADQLASADANLQSALAKLLHAKGDEIAKEYGYNPTLTPASTFEPVRPNRPD
jgi:hypothetical protein